MEKVNIIIYRGYDLVDADEWITLDINKNKVQSFVRLAKENNLNIEIRYFEK